MPSSLHKLLFHCIEVIDFFDVPIGQLSEEALEAMHKIFRKNRLQHTRESSRTNTCEDRMRNFLIMSYHFIHREVYQENIEKSIKILKVFLMSQTLRMKA